MNILAIDTLSTTLSVAAEGPEGSVTHSFTGKKASHAEQLLPLIDAVVSAAGFTATETHLVLAPEGPGSFTGLRLGYAAAKALQLSSNSTFIPIPTLLCIASQYESWHGNLATLIDAKRERFYIQLFKNNLPVTEVFDKTADSIFPFFTEDGHWLITGYGTDSFKHNTVIAQHSTRFRYIEAEPLSFAKAMIRYIQKRPSISANAADYAGPQYVRKTDAEKE